MKKEKGIRYISSPPLREISFDMKRMCDKEEWTQNKSTLVRKKFKEYFIRDQLIIKRDEIFEETRRILTQCRLFSKNSGISAVSHSFRMKIIEAFIKTQGKIEKEPILIHDYLHDDEKTFEFGKGFSVTENELPFLNSSKPLPSDSTHH